MAEESSYYDAVIVDLEAKRDHLNSIIEGLKQLRAVGVTSMSGASPTQHRPSQGDGEIAHDTFFGMTIADAARKYLLMAKHTKSTSEIGAALEQGGLKHASKNFTTTIRSTLGGRDEFVRVNGDWGLMEWYPGMRNKDRKVKVAVNGKDSSEDNLAAAQEASTVTSVNNGEPASIRKYIPKGNAPAIFKLLATSAHKTFSAKAVAESIQAKSENSVATLLSDLARNGRIARGTPNGYRANNTTTEIAMALR